MIFQPNWFRKNFALSHAVAGICAYALAIVVANLDKSIEEILILVARQAITTFLFTGLLVPRVQRRAIASNRLAVMFYGVLVPATIVAIASVTAHWYWTNEVRNILVPFFVSVALNSFLVSARRAGHETFLTQLNWFVKMIGSTR
jgi:hypothetical protein